MNLVKKVSRRLQPWRFRRRHDLWRLLMRLPPMTLTRNTRHGRMSFSTGDHVVGEHLFLFGHAEYELVERALAQVRRYGGAGSRPYLIDIGANIGTICIPLLLHEGFQRGLAIEPAPENVHYLRKNAAQNGLAERLTVIPMGLSAEKSTLRLELDPTNPGDHRIRMGTTAAPELHSESKRTVIEVAVDTLDHILAENGVAAEDIAAIFMDVQGHEGYVLQGAQHTLAAGMPLVMEFWPYGLRRAGTDPQMLATLLQPYYTHLVDLRAEAAGLQPLSYLNTIMNGLKDDQFTDVILFRNPTTTLRGEA
ncbi:MAG: FkbM family methyltransferase [Anaerolineae bacterium]